MFERLKRADGATELVSSLEIIDSHLEYSARCPSLLGRQGSDTLPPCPLKIVVAPSRQFDEGDISQTDFCWPESGIIGRLIFDGVVVIAGYQQASCFVTLVKRQQQKVGGGPMHHE